MITDGRPEVVDPPGPTPDYGHRHGYVLGASCTFGFIGFSDAGPLLAQWLAYYMAPKGHSLHWDGFAGDVPQDYVGYIASRISDRNDRGDNAFRTDWALLGFSGLCIVDAMAGPDGSGNYPNNTIVDQVANIESLKEIANNVFFEKICPSEGRSLGHLYSINNVTEEEFDERWAVYSEDYDQALAAVGGIGIDLWADWYPSLKMVPPYLPYGDYHPDPEAARVAATVVLNRVEQVYS
jgi:hypothetical protein